MEHQYISAEGISKAFGKVKALDNVCFSVTKGELFGFIGPDGAGKTTIFRILTSLLLPASGKASIAGLDVVKDYEQIRNRIGYMAGRFSLYRDLTVEENLRFYATIFNTTIGENMHLIRNIYAQIEPFRDRRAGNLSGGMKQKLALSCALIHRPELLILDEPTTGVDAVSRKEFWDMLKELKQEGITILVSTPYMDEASQCDRVALIQKGKILQIDTPSNIIDHFPQALYAVKGANIYRLLTDLEKYSNTLSAQPFGQAVHFSPVDKEKEPDELSRYLRENGHPLATVERVKPGIEDCFMMLMGTQTKES